MVNLLRSSARVQAVGLACLALAGCGGVETLPVRTELRKLIWYQRTADFVDAIPAAERLPSATSAGGRVTVVWPVVVVEDCDTIDAWQLLRGPGTLDLALVGSAQADRLCGDNDVIVKAFAEFSADPGTYRITLETSVSGLRFSTPEVAPFNAELH